MSTQVKGMTKACFSVLFCHSGTERKSKKERERERKIIRRKKCQNSE